jgi:2,3-bisphosphoglycerate-dependent phosphoglycerate mutase
MPPFREVVLIRHGEAHCNVVGVIASKACRGLTAVGGHQADQLARRLLVEHSAGRPVAHLYTSPVRRAAETADAIAQLIGIRPTVNPDFRVPDPGPEAEGQPWDLVRSRHRTDPDRPSRPLIPGGESWRHYLARTQAALAEVFNDHPGGRVVVIGHSETVTAAFTLLTGSHSLGALKLDLHPTGITRLTAAEERPNVQVAVPRWALTVHNDTEHLYHRFGTTQDYTTFGDPR